MRLARTLLGIGTLAVAGFALAPPTLAHGPGMMGPEMMGAGMGPGMMGGMGCGSGMMGPGMMGGGMGGMGPGMTGGMGHGPGPGMTGGGMAPGMMGPGMMGGMGYGSGPGMMGGGMGSGTGMMGGMQALRQDLTTDDVRHVMQHRLAWAGNPNLKLGAVEEKDADTIVAEVVTRDGSLVQRLEVDRHTGWTRPAPTEQPR